MGSGKTTLGRRVAGAREWDFIDLDAQLEAARGCKVRDLIEREGEPSFRALELEVLQDVLAAHPSDCVIATGGGIVETEAARRVLAELGCVVWLRADPDACVARLGKGRALRPLLDDESSWRARYTRREPWYRQLAVHVVETHPADVESSLAALLGCLDRVGPAA